MCHCLYQVLSKRFPQFPQNNIGAVGTVIFLRFINPAIGRLKSGALLNGQGLLIFSEVL